MDKVVGGDLDALRELEAGVFGATDVASPFRLRFAWTGEPKSVAAGTLQGTLHRERPGYGYLTFSLHELERDVGHRLTRPFFSEGQAFTLRFLFRRPDPVLERVVLGSLWLLCHFGGVGTRTRRGFGGVGAVEPATLAGFSFTPGGDIGAHYRLGLHRVEAAFRTFAERRSPVGRDAAPASEPTETPEFTSFRLWEGRLVAQPAWPTLKAWFNEWGMILRGFRNGATDDNVAPRALSRELRRVTRDYEEVVSGYMDSVVPESDDLLNDALGLPLIFQSSSRQRMQANVRWRLPGGADTSDEENKTHERRASPLFLRPVPLAEGQLGALVFAFPARFLPKAAQVELARLGARPMPIAVPTAADVTQTAHELFDYLDDNFTPRQPGARGGGPIRLP